jgi:precorrin-6A/cobalt-precorrin-6A reductase
MKVLLLAGTAEARELADIARWCNDIEMIASFAGLTRRPGALPCPVRIGGFGGVDGLVAFMREHAIDAIVDATHPFSKDMPRHALAAAHAACAPHARLVRPPWTRTDQDRWIDAEDLADAARVVARLGVSPVLLTIGRLDLAAFAGLEPVAFVVRTVESPESLPFRPVAVVRARGPFTVDGEAALMSAHGIELLVTKNAGGSDAKLVAARAARLPVVMVQRPQIVAEHSFTNAKDTLAWLTSVRR